jgi:hypothetical protein
LVCNKKNNTFAIMNRSEKRQKVRVDVIDKAKKYHTIQSLKKQGHNEQTIERMLNIKFTKKD